jgi:hypothetical protein
MTKLFCLSWLQFCLGEMSKIECQYNKERESIYSECFQMLNTKMKMIDSKRTAAICALQKKLFSTANLGRSSFGTADNIHYSPTKENVIPQQECQDAPISTPAFSGRTKEGAGMPLGGQHTKAHQVETPKEFSFKLLPRRTVMNSIFLTQGTDKSSTAGTGNEEDANVPKCNVDSSNHSYDLQQTCHQLSTVVIRRTGGSSNENTVLPFRSTRLFQENMNSQTDVPEKTPAVSSDPLGFDIMSEVMAIGKESEKQAVNDARGHEKFGKSASSGFADVNSLENCSFPVQCAQEQQASIFQGSIETVTPSQSQRDLSQDKYNSSECFNTSSQFMEEMYSDDSIERAAALIEQDQSIDQDGNMVSSYTETKTEAPVCVSSEVYAIPLAVLHPSLVSQEQGNSLNFLLTQLWLNISLSI